MPVLEVQTYPAPGLLTFDGLVIERWTGPPDGDSKRWHVRFIQTIALEQPDGSGRSTIRAKMDVVGKVVIASVSAEQRGAAEQLVGWIQHELTRRAGA